MLIKLYSERIIHNVHLLIFDILIIWSFDTNKKVTVAIDPQYSYH